MTIVVRNEEPADSEAIFELTRLAFLTAAHTCHTEQFIVNAPLLWRAEQFLFREVIAVGTVEVAERAGRLDHDVHAPHRLAAIPLLQGFWNYVHDVGGHTIFMGMCFISSLLA